MARSTGCENKFRAEAKRKEQVIMKKCSKCGAMNAQTSKFCYSCGAELCQTSDIMTGEEAEQSSMGSDEEKEISYKNKEAKGIPRGVRILLALIACLGIYMLYVIIGVALGWKRGGGMIPVLVMLACMGYAWRAITGKKG